MKKSCNIPKVLRNVDYALYLVTDDKFLKDKENVCEKFINKVREGIMGGVGLVQLRLKSSDDLYFYNMALKMKSILRKYNIPLIINNRVDICLGVGADGVHVGKADIPINIARNILGEKKIIGATINFSSEKDIEMAINNNVDYIAHEHTLYESSTKRTVTSYEHGIKEQINILHNNIKYLQKKGKICKNVYPITTPPIILIGGINTNNIKETMSSFHDTCEGVAVVSNIISEQANPFLNALKLKFVVNKYKCSYSIAFVNLFSSCLRYLFYNRLEKVEGGMNITNNLFHDDGHNNKHHMNYQQLATNMKVQKNVHYFFLNNLDLPIVELNHSIDISNKIKMFLLHSKYLNSNKDNSSPHTLPQLNSANHDHCKRVHNFMTKIKKEKILNNIFIFIGEKMYAIFKKHFSSTFFKLNYFFLITKNPQLNLGSFKLFECDIENVSIKYKQNFIIIILKRSNFNDSKIAKLGFYLSYFLIVQENITPEFLSRIVSERKDEDCEEQLLKFIAAVRISFEILANEHLPAEELIF
ncbi:thiamine-phosphate synthase [Plasmodium brasilianum]|uniref:thiamine phosphate synthase n=2 Tax=Plasmodium (Plasmodium) TaxID=418103 RepID=A0A1A8WWB4_PLAMA|nr:thiamin-phosphate pyrophosphorylase, putative [Plasmodium malariae]KAI4837358.1 thiamine-phosphate synthase [Plasmodium brasilianum]SBS96172.1 thiamin-phosphate pyrophosphorylase, putative [Plasmodium malariae]SCO93239.1 thiamin-phosphate pyrophosphorylase, putative [Plasmodium malariae]